MYAEKKKKNSVANGRSEDENVLCCDSRVGRAACTLLLCHPSLPHNVKSTRYLRLVAVYDDYLAFEC